MLQKGKLPFGSVPKIAAGCLWAVGCRCDLSLTDILDLASQAICQRTLKGACLLALNPEALVVSAASSPPPQTLSSLFQLRTHVREGLMSGRVCSSRDICLKCGG